MIRIFLQVLKTSIGNAKKKAVIAKPTAIKKALAKKKESSTDNSDFAAKMNLL